jgi:hypothetical protein
MTNEIDSNGPYSWYSCMPYFTYSYGMSYVLCHEAWVPGAAGTSSY